MQDGNKKLLQKQESLPIPDSKIPPPKRRFIAAEHSRSVPENTNMSADNGVMKSSARKIKASIPYVSSSSAGPSELKT